MKLIGSLFVAALAGKGGKKKAAAAAAAEEPAQRVVSSTPTIGPGDYISMDNYGGDLSKTWSVNASPGNSLIFTFDKENTSIDWRKDGCDDYLEISPYGAAGKALPVMKFCGPNGQDRPYMVTTDSEVNFPFTKAQGQRAWDFSWDTFAVRADVKFVSDGVGNGGSFKLKVEDHVQLTTCNKRKDCISDGLEHHLCEFHPVTKDKVCTWIECTRHEHCTDGTGGTDIQTCRGNACKKTECTSREHCTGKDGPHVCEKNECVPVDCLSHDDCPQDSGAQRCSASKCEKVECVGKSDCPETGICEGNKCTIHECLGHLSCGTSFPTKCADGQCKCDSRKCVRKECTKHKHCPDNELCNNDPEKDPTFTCYATHANGLATCRSHKSCGAKAKCEDHFCVSVQCRTNSDCADVPGGHHICLDESSPAGPANTCYKVDCNAHDQCGAKKVCQDNNCVPTACRKNDECGPNQLCEHPDKEDPTKNFCKDVDCRGHAACKENSKPACQDGRCLCQQNVCVVQECVQSKHCSGRKQKCHDNECINAECAAHDDCADQPAKCLPNCSEVDGRKYCDPKCQKVNCRKESDCDGTVPEICNKDTNLCEKVGCRGHSFCEDQHLCQNNVCVKQTCTTNEHCDADASEICVGNECKAVGCIGHDACGEKERCINHECVPRDCTHNDHCKGPGLFQKCDKINGICLDVECIGHTSCNRLSVTDAGYDCTDGKCLCKKNFCEAQTCRNNDHCGYSERCVSNVCESVSCTSHDHCPEKQVCFENGCLDVDCRENNHCGDKQVCGGEASGNTCEDVDCLGHDDCEGFGDGAWFCKEHTCVSVTCRVNDDCAGDNQICENNECSTVQCDSHEDCVTLYDSTHKCLSNVCEKVDCRLAEHCGAKELCNKETNTCEEVECRGHAMCQQNSETDSNFLMCANGHCTCIENKCEVNECRNNNHCGEKERCDTETNRCREVSCVGHDHCLLDSREACKNGECRCDENQCTPVTCRTADHCDDDQICSGEKPEDGEDSNVCVNVECKGHEDCGSKFNCLNHTCEEVDCTDETHCGEQELCRNGKCDPVECRDHTHCKDFFPGSSLPGYKCIQQTCRNLECTLASHCASNELCNKSTNECYTPECKGHNSCNSVAGCEDGKCLCQANKCNHQDCRTNEHCGFPAVASVCIINKCESVPCTSHTHCKTAAGGSAKSYCQGNQCYHDAECLTTPDCSGEKEICVDKKCIEKDCTKNLHCEGSSICRKNVCRPVECTTTADCDTGSICVQNYCIV